jgi:tetratricopeptide (TPR) repeat protein
MAEELKCFDESALLDRLSYGLQKRSQETVFLIGSALSAPLGPGAPGVLSVEGIINLVRNEFADSQPRLDELDKDILAAKERGYQAAFLFLQGRLGQSSANEIVKKAVLHARRTPHVSITTEAECRVADLDSEWVLNAGTSSVGKLVSGYPERFGKTLLTTNFDPLLQAAIRGAGGASYRTTLHSDGSLSQTEGTGCHVVHLHGYWYGSDTLHTAHQLLHPRSRLKQSLTSLLRNKLVLVCGYGGWDDVFTEALIEVVQDDSAMPEILWCFHQNKPAVGPLQDRLGPGVSRGRVSLYSCVDCNVFFPKLLEAWKGIEDRTVTGVSTRTNSVRLDDAIRRDLERAPASHNVLEGDDEDRPPHVEFCLGRDEELRQLKESSAKVIFVTGIGGQGKSTVAAQYFSDLQSALSFKYFIWRDCKQESERFENQLASVVESLSGGRLSGQDLASQSAESLVDLLVKLTANVKVLLVFDNVDHYVNLESLQMTSAPERFIHALLSSNSRAQLVLTCRPAVAYDHPEVLSCGLQGISIDAARKLFSERHAPCSADEIKQAHELTDGHAFWLDLLAVQVVKNGGGLNSLLARIRSGTGQLPTKTLNSIWTMLSEREQLVLRSMSETVRPASEFEITDYLSDRLTYQKVMRALKSLRAMNLIVVKPRPPADDLLELHPLVRRFVHQTFSPIERSSFIERVIGVYKSLVGNHRSQLRQRPSFTILQYWTQTAEVDLAGGRIKDALDLLREVADAFISSPYCREFSRIARLALEKVDWVADYAKYRDFDVVFYIHINILALLGEIQEVDKLLDLYEMTVQDKDARYILYCMMKCESLWERGQFTEAVIWGKRGQALKTSSNVDTKYDPSQRLALAERDAGRPEVALVHFLAGRTLDEVIDPDELDQSRGGHHYGNIGRCLHMMGQIDSALICYQKSAILIEKDLRKENLTHQGFIRRWIGELMIARKQYRLAKICLEAAIIKWEQVSPHRTQEIRTLLTQYEQQLPRLGLSDDDIEHSFRQWVVGQDMDTPI